MINNPIIRQGDAVVVMGLGVSGRAAVEYMHGCGATVYDSDSRHKKDLSTEELNLIANCCSGYEGGGHTGAFLKKGDMIFLSPGISCDHEVLKGIDKKKIPVIGELALAAPVLSEKVIAITGTNGKTTVTTLIGELLEKAGYTVFVGGNIGKPLFEYLMGGESADVVVVEVSSFQLELAGEFRPDVAVLLNITPDHLDRHGDFVEYIRAKARIFTKQQDNDYAILGGDDLICREIAEQLNGGETMLFCHDKDCHAQICESEIYLKWKSNKEVYQLKDTVFDNHIGRLNSAAAILATRAVGAEEQGIQQGLQSFQPLPHRMQRVCEIDGITFCNDSKATNTGAVLSALQQISGSVILIAGGRDKGDDYTLLKNTVQKKVKQLILIGEAAKKIATQLSGIVDIEYAGTMEEAVEISNTTAVAGDTVLLSPACASFDMFDSYGHRGETFINAVQQLQAISVHKLRREK